MKKFLGIRLTSIRELRYQPNITIEVYNSLKVKEAFVVDEQTCEIC